MPFRHRQITYILIINKYIQKHIFLSSADE